MDRLALSVAFSSALLVIVSGLMCYNCNENYPNFDYCLNATKHNCTEVLKSADPAVCTKTVTKYKTDQPSTVFADCQLASAFEGVLVGICSQQLVSQNDTKNRVSLAMCTCNNTDYCNSAFHTSANTVAFTTVAFFAYNLY